MFRGLFLSIMVLAAAASVLSAQSAPVLRTDSIVAEFISSNARPRCVIRGIFIDGPVDTVRAALKTSTIRTTVGGYARYKPVIDSVWLEAAGSERHEMMIRLRLTGQRVPLPTRGVRGVVRLTVAAAVWTGNDWASSVSEELEVPIANLEIPRPVITISGMTKRRVRSTPRLLEFEVSGIALHIPKPEMIGTQKEIRAFDIEQVTAQFDDGSLETSDSNHDSLRTVRVTATIDPAGVVTIRGSISSPGAQPGAKVAELSNVRLSILLRARLKCRAESGPYRSRLIEVEL